MPKAVDQPAIWKCVPGERWNVNDRQAPFVTDTLADKWGALLDDTERTRGNKLRPRNLAFVRSEGSPSGAGEAGFQGADNRKVATVFRMPHARRNKLTSGLLCHPPGSIRCELQCLDR